MTREEHISNLETIGCDGWTVTTDAYKSLQFAIQALEQEPCPNAISRSDMLDAIGHGTTYTSEELQRIIKGLPSVNLQSCEDAISRQAFALEEQASKTEWIAVSERLPEDFGLYLITLENGDVCQCEFNPDFIDEEHENGAFTYYHQYFDSATLGMIDEEEEAVDAIAWAQFEPFEPQESEKV